MCWCGVCVFSGGIIGQQRPLHIARSSQPQCCGSSSLGCWTITWANMCTIWIRHNYRWHCYRVSSGDCITLFCRNVWMVFAQPKNILLDVMWAQQWFLRRRVEKEIHEFHIQLPICTCYVIEKSLYDVRPGFYKLYANLLLDAVRCVCM